MKKDGYEYIVLYIGMYNHPGFNITIDDYPNQLVALSCSSQYRYIALTRGVGKDTRIETILNMLLIQSKRV